MESIISAVKGAKKLKIFDPLDLIASAELGDAREVMSGQLQSPSNRLGLQTLFVLNPKSSTTDYILSHDSTGEEFVLSAQLDESNNGFNIFRHKSGDVNYDESSPNVRLSYNTEHDKWTARLLTESNVCDRFTYKRREWIRSTSKPIILEIKHGVEQLGNGQHWFYLNATGPSSELGDPIYTCMNCQENKSVNTQPKLALNSVLPTVRNGDLSIKFYTKFREIAASSRNLQCTSATHENRVVFQFVRLVDGRMNMDYKSPLCPVQAFCLALSTHFWL